MLIYGNQTKLFHKDQNKILWVVCQNLVNKEVRSLIKFFTFHDTLSSSKQILVLSVLLSRTDQNKSNLQILEQIWPKNTHKRKQFLSMKILFDFLAIKGIPTNLSVLPKRTQI